jgi:hypothetical protein
MSHADDAIPRDYTPKEPHDGFIDPLERMGIMGYNAAQPAQFERPAFEDYDSAFRRQLHRIGQLRDAQGRGAFIFSWCPRGQSGLACRLTLLRRRLSLEDAANTSSSDDKSSRRVVKAYGLLTAARDDRIYH